MLDGNELGTQLFFKTADVLPQVRWRDVQRRRRVGELKFVRNGDYVAQHACCQE